MTDDDKRTLHPATAAELEETLSFALRYAGKRRVHTADDVMARVTAERLVQHLERSGYVLMKRPAKANTVQLGDFPDHRMVLLKRLTFPVGI